MGDIWDDARNLQLDSSFVGTATPLAPRAKHGPTPQVMGRFVRGPVPVAWLDAAGDCGLNALRVGLAIWHKSGMKDWALTVSLTSADARRFGVDHRQTKHTALRRLKWAGLISTNQVGLKAVEVTILRANGED